MSGAHERCRHCIEFGRNSEIRGRAIGSIMMIASQTRSQPTPLKDGLQRDPVSDNHLDVEVDRRGQQPDLDILDDHAEPSRIGIDCLGHRQEHRQRQQQDAERVEGTSGRISFVRIVCLFVSIITEIRFQRADDVA